MGGFVVRLDPLSVKRLCRDLTVTPGWAQAGLFRWPKTTPIAPPPGLLGEWNLEAIQAHADSLSLKDTELNLKELKASCHTPQARHRTNAEPKDSAIAQSRRKKSPLRFLVRA